MKRIYSLLLLVCACVFVTYAYAKYPQQLGCVSDYAHVLHNVEEQLVTELVRFKEETGVEFLVVTVPTLDGEIPESYIISMLDAWQGDSVPEKSIVLFVASNDHILRTLVTGNMFGLLNKSELVYVRNSVIIPSFKNGNIELGIVNGVHKIMELVLLKVAPTINVATLSEANIGFRERIMIVFNNIMSLSNSTTDIREMVLNTFNISVLILCSTLVVVLVVVLFVFRGKIMRARALKCIVDSRDRVYTLIKEAKRLSNSLSAEEMELCADIRKKIQELEAVYCGLNANSDVNWVKLRTRITTLVSALERDIKPLQS